MPEFVDPLRVVLDPSATAELVPGPLTGLRLAVKDVIDLLGIATGAGNPTYLAGAAPAPHSALAVVRLLIRGARPIGKAHTDELAFSLSGTNVHYGTPRNTAAPGRVPGGSSSGSAAAVAAGIADIALGTDTAGSVRVPASYCGVYGLRPTHGRVPLTGIVPLAPSFDTCGLFAADGATLARAGVGLLTSGLLSDAVSGGRQSSDPPQQPTSATAPPDPPPESLTLATDLLAEADAPVAAAVRAGAGALAAALGIELREGTLCDGRLTAWLQAFRGRQFVEVWQAHGDWLESARPVLGPGVAARFAAARDTPAEAAAAAGPARDQVLEALGRLLPPGGALVLPAAATVAPLPTLDATVKDDVRLRTMRLTCVAGLAGAPAVSIPTVTANERLPAGICLLGRPGDDERLLVAAQCWAEHRRLAAA
jgi:amidase